MTELIHLNRHRSMPASTLPVVVLVEEDEAYYHYVCDALKGAGVRLVWVTGFAEAKEYLQKNPAPAVLIFDYWKIGNFTTEDFVEWVQSEARLKFAYMVLATAELYAEDLVRRMAIHDWIPKNMSQDILGQHIAGACDYYKEERANN